MGMCPARRVDAPYDCEKDEKAEDRTGSPDRPSLYLNKVYAIGRNYSFSMGMSPRLMHSVVFRPVKETVL